jgi:hypothetical protein
MKITKTNDAGHLAISRDSISYAVGRCAVLLKCANPKCCQQWHYLREGKLFHLSPTPEIEALIGDSSNKLYERFWLCERCAQEMTLVWGGTHVQLIPVSTNQSLMQAASRCKAARPRPAR